MIGIETINKPININTKESLVNLSMGIYNVYIIGGWYVDLGKFNFYLNKTNNGDIIKPKKTFYTGNLYYKNQRAKLKFSFEIKKGGKFRVNFENQNSLIVKKRSFLLGYLFGKKIDAKKIEIIFERK
ncbi:hypothetical protein [Tenacibaculum sp. M341]|uniref:hypothetical protein n=1 Tax=Tenacibaculum sp. M341 TaxID=2530339 RepID=UPI001050E922|nr:hypothetical protein [Tenacibaculum sp. M341]TCI93049.1 hypothetical protein EYW44_05360 [Tenacibaculum sp. M341]